MHYTSCLVVSCIYTASSWLAIGGRAQTLNYVHEQENQHLQIIIIITQICHYSNAVPRYYSLSEIHNKKGEKRGNCVCDWQVYWVFLNNRGLEEDQSSKRRKLQFQVFAS